MVWINVQNLVTRDNDTFVVSRVPIRGEMLWDKDHDTTMEVVDVIHVLDVDEDSDDPAAIVRVK